MSNRLMRPQVINFNSTTFNLRRPAIVTELVLVTHGILVLGNVQSQIALESYSSLA